MYVLSVRMPSAMDAADITQRTTVTSHLKEWVGHLMRYLFSTNLNKLGTMKTKQRIPNAN